MIYTITLNPAIDKTVYVENLKVNQLNRVKESCQSVGGKGINVSKALKVLNSDSIAMGIVAGATGDFLISELNKAGITCRFQKVAGITRTNLKIINDDRQLTEVNEAGPWVSKQEIQQFQTELLSKVVKDDVVVLSGSVTTNVSKDVYYQLTLLLKEVGCKVIMDADGELFASGVSALPTLIKPNAYEICQYFKVEETNDVKILAGLADKLLALGIEYVVISLGSQGALFFSKEGSYQVLALDVEVNSTVGAGDAMVAGLTKALAEKLDYVEMIKLAVATSASAVITKGTDCADLKVIADLKQRVKLIKL